MKPLNPVFLRLNLLLHELYIKYQLHFFPDMRVKMFNLESLYCENSTQAELHFTLFSGLSIIVYDSTLT